MKKINRNFLLGMLTTLVALPAFAQDAAAHAGSASSGWVAIGAALAMGIAALGGALGQGRAVAAAMDGIARNPAAQQKMFVPMILGLVFIETLVLFSFVIAFQLYGKV
ncbi:MAG TPA: ATP synthase F0 subunit C [Bdellovibrionales bacterium]|nr:ATP synthase F0 subunit C [Bdellovibrionales bacterium]